MEKMSTKRKQSLKENTMKGITLIALVITIIVLIILAGVSMNLILGENGIIEKAKNAKKITEDSAWMENAQMIALQAKMSREEIEKLTDEEIATTNRR